MKGQASVEFLLIVGIAFIAIIPVTYIFFNFAQDSGDELLYSQLEAVGREVVKASEEVYFAGRGSKTVIEVTVPDGVNTVRIYDQRELVFEVETRQGVSDILFISRVNLTTQTDCALGGCTIPFLHEPGVKEIVIKAEDGESNVTQIQ